MPRKRRPDPNSLPYGQRQELEQTRQQLGAAAAAIRSGPRGQGPGTPPQQAPGSPPPGPAALAEAAFAAAQAAPDIGAGLLSGPSRRPNEPVTAGLSTGPGPGPEALGLQDQTDPDLVALAPYLPALELMANGPGATVQSRNLVRRLRAIVPPPALR